MSIFSNVVVEIISVLSTANPPYIAGDAATDPETNLRGDTDFESAPRAIKGLAMKKLAMTRLATNPGATLRRARSIKHQPNAKRYYIDVGIGSIRLSGADTGGAYCLLEASLAPGMMVPRHTHTREDETYHVLAGELEVVVGDEIFVLKTGDTLMAPRDIPHQLRNSGDVENHYILVFSPSGIEEFFRALAVPAPDHAVAPTEPPAALLQNVRELAALYGILPG
jgi:quercetin dioxygenase-like cupin family protein